MHLPILSPPPLTTSRIDAFGGIDRTPSCPESAFSHTENTTSLHYPNLAVRNPRIALASLPEHPSALHTTNGIAYTVGNSLWFNGVLQYNNLESSPKKQIVSMGTKVIVFPDGYYIDTLSVDSDGLCTKRGYVTTNTVFVPPAFVTVSPCDSSGTLPTPSDSPPDPQSVSLWLDTSVHPNLLKTYSPEYGSWFTVDATHTVIHIDGIHHYVIQGRLTSIKGITDEVDGISTVTLVGDSFFVINKKCSAFSMFDLPEGEPITFKGVLPKLDFVCEHRNRLFGCRYGADHNGNFVNEIYASKLGEPGDWFAYNGLSTDSYAASCGSDGPFTGIASHLGYVVYFKENRIHRLFGTKPANYTLYDDLFPGVALGSEKSLCLNDGTLYYLGREGVYAYSGSSPSLISRPLGKEPMTEGVGGISNNRYRLSVKNALGHFDTYTYDIHCNLWHREDSSRYVALSPIDCNLLGIRQSDVGYSLELLEPHPIPSLCTKIYGSENHTEPPLTWSAESGYLGYHSDKCKFLSKIRLRLVTEENSSVTLFYKADSDQDWQECGSLSGKKAGSYSLYFVPPRCDRIKLLIKGKGNCKLLSVTKSFESAGEVM